MTEEEKEERRRFLLELSFFVHSDATFRKQLEPLLKEYGLDKPELRPQPFVSRFHDRHPVSRPGLRVKAHGAGALTGDISGFDSKRSKMIHETNLWPEKHFRYLQMRGLFEDPSEPSAHTMLLNAVDFVVLL